MARRRPTPAKSSKKKNTPSQARVEISRFRAESLEPRRLFVVLHGGDTFQFWAENSHMERVVVTGNTTVELFGTNPLVSDGLAPQTAPVLDTMQGEIISGPDRGVVGYTDPDGTQHIDYPPEALPQGGGGGSSGTSMAHDANIWSIYVSQSDANSSIAIASTNPLGSATFPMLPFTGSETVFVGNENGGPDISVTSANTGTVYIGARALPPMGTGVTATNFPTNQPIIVPAAVPDGVNGGGIAQTVSPGITSLKPGLIVTLGNNLGQFLVGGTLTGDVNIHGAINLFYAGWLLTGNALGGVIGGNADPDNFNVDGDIHTLLTNGSIGTNTDSGLTDLGSPNYVTNFDMHVGGKAGMIKSLDSFVGSVDVSNSPTAPSLDGIPYAELDVRGGDPWASGTFGGDPTLNDQNFLGAQFVGQIDNTGTVEVTGQIQAESATVDKSVDYYAVPLMAGQTVTAQATSTGIDAGLDGVISLGVFDPLDHLIATDYNAVAPVATNGQPFQFTAKTPGIYNFAVSEYDNNSFTAGGGPLDGTLPYTLTVKNVGDLGLAGLAATTNVLTEDSAQDPNTTNVGGLQVANGDLGAVFAGNLIMSDFLDSYYVDNGNLRAVTASSIGNGEGPSVAPTAADPGTASAISYAEFPGAHVPNGSVGMLRATGTANGTGQGGTSILAWDDPSFTSADAIGGDYQMIDCANELAGFFYAQGNIGTVRAGGLSSDPVSVFDVNALDDTTKHGTIDLIDVARNFGTLATGGPEIITGPGGNCRYIHVDGTTYRDAFFGGGQPEATLFQPGETATITDDSGATVTLTPANAADSLSIVTYPIEGSGGSAIVSVEVLNTTAPGTAGGVTVTSSGGGSAEIGAIILDGSGQPVTAGTITAATTTTTTTVTTTGNFPAPGTPGGAPIAGPGSTTTKFTLPNLPSRPTIAATGTPMVVNISGSDPIDVYSITANTTGLTNAGNPTTGGAADVSSLTNSTGGEIVNLQLGALGTASIRGALGVALKQNTNASVIGNVITGAGMAFTYPLYLVSSLARITGNVISISAGTLGNVYAGTINGDTAAAVNSTPPAIPNGLDTNTGTNGQIGSIQAGTIVGSVVAAGAINSVNAGSIGAQGSGANGAPGIFSTGLIGPMSVNGDVRGQIVSTVGQLGLTISNGSLNNAIVANYARFDYAEARALLGVSPTTTSPFTRPVLDLASVVIKGNGGIIGSKISGEHVGTVSVAKTGFGIFSSFFGGLGDATILGVQAGGYGIRNSFFEGGATFGAITALGDGSEVPVTAFSSSLRNSENGDLFDPVTGLEISIFNDLDVYLGTSATAPRIVGSTESGVIENTIVEASRDLGTLNAYSIRGRAVTSTNPFLVVDPGTVINVANMVAQINVPGPIDELFITTGRTSKYNFGGRVTDFDLTVSGPIGTLNFKSGLFGTSLISAIGPAGRIASLIVHGNFSGTIKATKGIGTIQVLGSLSGLVQAASLGTLKLSGGLGQGSLAITGNIGTIQTTGDFGVPGNNLTINGSLKALKIGGNLNTGVTIGKNLGMFIVGGSIQDAGNVSVGGIITQLTVDGDVDAGAIVKAHLIKKRLIKGQLLGTITTA